MGEISQKSAQGIRFAADIIRGSKNAIVLTGAGISTPSGIADFRSVNTGLWSQYDPYEVASLASFRYQPEKFFNWIRPLVQGIHNSQPNPAHIGLARLEKAGYIKTVITQNIDGLHQRSGSRKVLEVHGTLNTLTCGSCFQQVQSVNFMHAYLEFGEIPRCPNCTGQLKPDIILFGEQLPAHTWLEALNVSKGCDLMIVAGSSLEVLPVAGLPMRAVENGAHLIIINQTPTYIDVRADVVFTDDVAIVIPMIANEVLDA